MYDKRGSDLIKFSDYPNPRRPYLAEMDDKYLTPPDEYGTQQVIPILLAGQKAEDEEVDDDDGGGLLPPADEEEDGEEGPAADAGEGGDA